MIDTIRVQWQGVAFCDEFADWMRSEYPTAKQSVSYYDENLPWSGMAGQDAQLGSISVKSNKQGNFLTVERSLPKFMFQDNCRVLSVDQVQRGLSHFMEAVEHRFSDWWMVPNPRETAKVKRVDLCYQQKVPCSNDVFAHLATTLKARKVVRHTLVLNPVEVHLTGITYHQSKHELGRWYDKGIESGNESYQDVVRHEEQLRGGKAEYLVDVSGAVPVLRVEEGIQRMNERYEGWGSLESFDLGALLSGNGMAGAVGALLVLNPEHEPVYRRVLPKSTFYRGNALAMEARRQKSLVDMRLPADAWAQPMVL